MESSTFLIKTPPTRPIAAYIGGKRLLAKTIIKRIEAVPHRTYSEAFVGMGGVFLRRPFRARSEVINDYSGDVSNLFRILQRHYVAFLDMLKYQLTSRSEFARLVDTNPKTLTDLERAARFLYLQRTAFGGKVSGKNFGVSVGLPSRFDLIKLVPMLEDVHERLSGVIIEQLDFEAFLLRYDRADTLFYLDPPYWGCEDDYGKEMFCRDDFTRLERALKGLRGRFILSLNDNSKVRELFSNFDIEAVKTRYSVNGKDHKQVGELLISN
jgi:DNA adenine methylase